MGARVGLEASYVENLSRKWMQGVVHDPPITLYQVGEARGC